tara:strand:+ start:507 stop:1364 length:858 start_codon:yes stop_codon:yes gene_type:complete
MKCLVTGGAGFIGSHLVDRLVTDGNEVIVWDDLTTGKRDQVHEDAKFYHIPVEGISPKYHHTDKHDAIFHLAAEARIQPSFEFPQRTHDSNVTGTMKILELARYTGAKIIYAGSSSVYHDQYANPYSFTKLKAEEYCTLYNRIYKVPVAIARFFNVYGPRQLETGVYATVVGIFEKQYRNGEPLTITGTGDQRRDFTHVEDIVNGLVAMSEEEWNADIFNLGTGTNYSINELANMFQCSTVYVPARPGEAKDTLADIHNSKANLGWRPKRCLKEYVDALLTSEQE